MRRWEKIRMMNRVKKISIIAFTLIMILTVTGCTTSIGNGTGTMHVPTKPSSENSKFSKFEKSLTEAGIEFEKVELKDDAKATGAVTAVQYKFKTGTVEIYSFDESTNEYIEVSYERKITKANGDVVPVAIMEELGLYTYGFKNTEDVAQIMEYITLQWA